MYSQKFQLSSVRLMNKKINIKLREKLNNHIEASKTTRLIAIMAIVISIASLALHTL